MGKTLFPAFLTHTLSLPSAARLCIANSMQMRSGGGGGRVIDEVAGRREEEA